MRKFLAFMMMFIILTGVFSPVTFLLNKDRDGTQVKSIIKKTEAAEADKIEYSNLSVKIQNQRGKDVILFEFTVNFIKNDGSTENVSNYSNDMKVYLLEAKVANPNLTEYKGSEWEPIDDAPDFTEGKYNTIKYNTPQTIKEFFPNKNIKKFDPEKLYAIMVAESETDGRREWYAISTFRYNSTENTVVQQEQANTNEEITEGGLECKWTNLLCNLVQFTVYLLGLVPNFVATIVGVLSDFFLKLAINPATYGKSYETGIGEMIYSGWVIIRDFANIGFIFALFVSAFMLILNKTNVGGKNFDPKKVVTRVIIMALLVNFSLFFCRMIIQTADVFSHLLYNKITITMPDKGAMASFLKSNDIKSVSFGIVENTNPQQIITNADITKDTKGAYVTYLALGVATFFVYFVLIYLFVSMMFIWLGRIVGLWLSMILSPLAFVSWAIPFIENDDYIGFQNWLKNFANLAFLAPIYLFFVYLAITVMGIGSLGTISGTSSGGGEANAVYTIISTMLPLLASTFILVQGKTIAYKMSGKIGELAGKASGMATSVALGAATGGTALLARQTLGRAGNAIGNSKGLMNAENNKYFGAGARMLRNAGKGMGAATFDVRNSPSAMKGFSKFTGAMGEKIDLGDKFQQKEGGFKKEGGIRENLDKATTAAVQWNEDRKKANADALAADMAEVHAKERKGQEEMLEAAEQAKASEETNIKTEANNQLVVDTINVTAKLEANELAIDQINTDINKVNTDIAQNNTDLMNLGFNQSAYDDAMRNKTQADTDVGNIQKELADNREKQKTAGYGHSAELKKQEKEIETKLKNAENVQKVATETAKTQDDKLAEKTRLETKALDLSKTREDLEKAKTNLEKEEDKLHSYLAYEDYTLIEAEEQINADKIAAENTDSGRDYKRAQGETKEQEKKVSELQKQKTSVEKEYGKNSIEADKIQEKINKEKKTLDDIKKVEKDLKEVFEEVTGMGHLNSMLNAIKEEKKKYITNQQHRVDDTERFIGKTKADLAQTVANQNKELYRTMNTAAENAQRGSIIPDFTGARAATVSTHIQNQNMGTGSYGNNSTSGNTNNKGKK